MKKDARSQRCVLLALAAVSGSSSASLAIPLAPFLYKKHFIVLVLMRPTKEVLLAGGFLLRLGKIGGSRSSPRRSRSRSSACGTSTTSAAHTPADPVREGMPWWSGRILKPDRVKAMQSCSTRKGMRLVFLGRLAVFPSSVVGRRPGSGDVQSREFLPADAHRRAAVDRRGDRRRATCSATRTSRPDRGSPWRVSPLLVAIAFIVARFLRRDEKRKRAFSEEADVSEDGRKAGTNTTSRSRDFSIVNSLALRTSRRPGRGGSDRRAIERRPVRGRRRTGRPSSAPSVPVRTAQSSRTRANGCVRVDEPDVEDAVVEPLAP